MAYDKYKDFTKGTQSYKVLKYKAFKIASNLEYDECQRGLPSMVFKFFDKKSVGSYIKGAYIKYVGGGTRGFYKFFRRFFVAQETIDLNISWPSNFFRKHFMSPPINFLI